MRKRMMVALMAVVLASVQAMAQAGDPEEEGLLAARVQKLEDSRRLLPTPTGYVQPLFNYDERDDHYNTFNIRRAMLNLTGHPADWMEYRLQANLAGSAQMLDAWLRLKVNRQVNFQFGQFKTPFSLENQYSPLVIEMVNNAQVTDRLAGFQDESGYATTGRDMGLAFYGAAFRAADGHDRVEYTLGLFNGASLNRKDNDRYKDLIVRLDLHPLKPLTLSASGYLGKNAVEDEEGHYTALKRNRLAAGARWEDDKLMVRSEYMAGQTGSLHSDGWYLVAGYWVSPKVQALLRYDAYRHDTSLRDGTSTLLTLGAVCNPAWFLRLQANYAYRLCGKNLADEKDGHSLVLMSTFRF